MAESDKHVAEVVAVLHPYGDEALYVDGKMVLELPTIYMGDLAEHVGDRPIAFKQAILAEDFSDKFDNWPKKYEDLIPYIEAD